MQGGGDEDATIRLDPVLDTAAAGPLIEAIRARRGAPLRLDASEVRVLGAACLQALLAAEAAWRADGGAFALVDPSESFRADAATLGAAARLPFPAEA